MVPQPIQTPSRFGSGDTKIDALPAAMLKLAIQEQNVFRVSSNNWKAQTPAELRLDFSDFDRWAQILGHWPDGLSRSGLAPGRGWPAAKSFSGRYHHGRVDRERKRLPGRSSALLPPRWPAPAREIMARQDDLHIADSLQPQRIQPRSSDFVTARSCGEWTPSRPHRLDRLSLVPKSTTGLEGRAEQAQQRKGCGSTVASSRRLLITRPWTCAD